ncbi:hypothetical protein [Streptomyces sp. NPDC050504]|uniref:hypothetical protein n=1 Tax=Streptomyces sp. NPDC050504 TaxID=3365618 RepID=UPI0037A54736
MTAADRPSSVPRQTPPPGGDGARPPEDRRHMIRRRWITAVIIVLLVGVPAGYLVISAEQSRRSGRDKEAESSGTGLQEGWPSKMKRRIYEMPIPPRSSEVQYYETSNWKVSRLFVQFRTTSVGLDNFLTAVGTGRPALGTGEVAVTRQDADTVGWRFGPDRHWAGTIRHNPDPRPTLDITVDLTDPASPTVYVVSTATP